MARRKRKEEEPAWTPPEFDEVGYMRQEIEAARASVLTVAWAAVGAVLSFALFASGQPITAFFAGLLFSVLLYWVGPVLRVRTREFKRRDWAGQGSIYFFSWLAFWILLINAPFGDFTSPSVNGLVVGSYSLAAGLPNPGGMACSVPVGSAISIDTGANDTLYVLFRATDNVAIAGVAVVEGGSANVPATLATGDANLCRGASGTYGPGTYLVTLPVPGAGYTLTFTATDTAGRTATARLTITIP